MPISKFSGEIDLPAPTTGAAKQWFSTVLVEAPGSGGGGVVKGPCVITAIQGTGEASYEGVKIDPRIISRLFVESGKELRVSFSGPHNGDKRALISGWRL